ncbi:MAG: translation initiation factor IF-2 [Bacilli bacterium]|nr:translation initiation factor IF-2 [Bacilli bacterium]MDD4734408.1 translation initiation factor IF-2 [Bacilli bacterium]
MSVLEYAQDINKKAAEVLKKCEQLGYSVSLEDMLDEEQIIELDNAFANDDDEIEDIEVVVDNKKIITDNIIVKQKLKKKADIKPTIKKDIVNKKKEMYKNKEKLISNTANVVDENVIYYKENTTVNDLAKTLDVSASELLKKLFALGILANINNSIAFEQAELLAIDYGKELKKEVKIDEVKFEEIEINDKEEDLIKRAPVVTIMGHVDHGKTTLLDTIRKSNVAEGEAGGITQAISAYQAKYKGEIITFIDTPGHAAFTEMRARGANITDIVIIIVAADDGVMPQTKEAIDHAKAAGVPILVAINKIDKPGSNIDRIMTDLTESGLTPEEWGGDTIFTKISAKEGTGIDELLENILLVAEMGELKANPNRYAMGTVIESRLDKHLGPLVTVLIQNGTLRLGDPIVVGDSYGKIRTLKSDKGEEITEAIPSMPVEITGLNATPIAGDKFMAFETEKQARNIGEQRKISGRKKDMNIKQAVSLEDLFSKIQEGAKEINVIVKSDVNGSSEAVKNSLEKIEVEGVKINVLRSSVGNITESDIVLAKASEAILIAFNIRPNAEIRDYAKEQNIEIRFYDIIYKLVEDMEAAMKGMLDPVYEEKITGSAEVRQLFKFSKVGIIAGSYILDGIIKRDSKARVIRDGVVIYDGSVNSLQREKDSVKEVKKGLECGITIDNFNDIKAKDIIEAYELVEVK